MKWTLELESFKWFLHYRDNRLENPDFISEPKECTFCQSNTVSPDWIDCGQNHLWGTLTLIKGAFLDAILEIRSPSE